MTTLTAPRWIDELSLRELRAALHANPRPLTIDVDSHGGSVACGLEMATAIEEHGKVTAHVRRADSSALLLVAAAQRVSVATNAEALVHRASVTVPARTSVTPEEVRRVGNEAVSLEARMIAYLAAHSNKPAAWWRERQDPETTLDARALHDVFTVKASAQAEPTLRLTPAQASGLLERLAWAVFPPYAHINRHGGTYTTAASTPLRARP